MLKPKSCFAIRLTRECEIPICHEISRGLECDPSPWLSWLRINSSTASLFVRVLLYGVDCFLPRRLQSLVAFIFFINLLSVLTFQFFSGNSLINLLAPHGFPFNVPCCRKCFINILSSSFITLYLAMMYNKLHKRLDTYWVKHTTLPIIMVNFILNCAVVKSYH